MDPFNRRFHQNIEKKYTRIRYREQLSNIETRMCKITQKARVSKRDEIDVNDVLSLTGVAILPMTLLNKHELPE